jgi:hypothetical protein
MKLSLLSSLLIASVALPACGNVRHIAPPALPEAALPNIAVPPPSNDASSTVVVITTDVPARVVRTSAYSGRSGRHFESGTVEELVCEQTPCTASLPYGDHELRFTALYDRERFDDTTIHVQDPRVVLNHTLGRSHSPSWRGVGTALVLTGLATMLAGGAAGKGTHDGTMSAALVTAGALTTVGGTAILAGFPSIEQPGSTREWAPPVNAAAGLTLGSRF